jgi:hypothetical protein
MYSKVTHRAVARAAHSQESLPDGMDLGLRIYVDVLAYVGNGLGARGRGGGL